MMKSVGFVCPNISSVFRSSGTPSTDPAVRDVANAIYQQGRIDGLQGMAAVAHVIQNRAKYTALEPEHIVNHGAQQFTSMRQGHIVPHSTIERQLFDHATRMAVQLVKAPRRLTSPDPTGGALYYDHNNPARLHSTSQPIGSRGNVSNCMAASGTRPAATALGDNNGSNHISRPASGDTLRVPCASGSRFAASGQLQQAAPVSMRAASPSSDIEQYSPPASPRPVPPTKSLKPLAFLRDRAPAGLSRMRWRNSDAPAASQTSATMADLSTDVSSASSSTPTVVLPPASLGTPALGAAPAAPFGDSGDACSSPPPSPPLSPPRPISIPVSTPGPQAGVTSRLRASRPRPSSRTGPAGSDISPRLITGRIGPADADGYHDMILPCGLCQDEVIELMYRDISPEDFEALCKLDERVPKRNTAKGNIVDRLPRVAVKDCSATECGVCLAEFDTSASVIKLPCRHFFHPNCISKWLTQCKNTCPLCTAPIEQEASSNARSSSGTAPSSTLRAV